MYVATGVSLLLGIQVGRVVAIRSHVTRIVTERRVVNAM